MLYFKVLRCEIMKNNKKVVSLMSNLQSYYHFKLDFQKVDQHTGPMSFFPVAKRNGLMVNLHFSHRYLCLFLVCNPLQQRQVWFTGQGDLLHCPLPYRAFYGLFYIKRHGRQRKPVNMNSILDCRYYHEYIFPNNCIPNWKYVIKHVYTAKKWLSISC